jgi:hypothetical protein
MLVSVLVAAGVALVVTVLDGAPTVRGATTGATRRAPGPVSSAPDALGAVVSEARADGSGAGAGLAPQSALGARREHAAKTPERLLAQGIVTDESGRAVPGATVAVERLVPQEDGGPARWRAAEGLACTSDEDGRFRLVGCLEGGRIALTALHPRYSSGLRTECEVGESGIALRLRAAGSIAGRIDLEPSLSVTLFVVSASTVEPEAPHYAGTLAVDGTFEIPRLPSGSYDVVLSLEHEPRTAITLADVLVTAGGVTELAPLDLRGRVTAFRLRLRDADGRPPPNAFVRRRSPGEAEFEPRLQPVREGDVVVATLEPCVDLRIESPLHRSEELECVSADRELALRPAPTVHLALDEGLSLRNADLRLGVSLERRGEKSGLYGRLSSFDEWGKATAVVEEPGAYDVRVYAWRNGPNGVASLLSNRVETQIDVPLDAPEPFFAVRLSPETIAQIDAGGRSAN